MKIGFIGLGNMGKPMASNLAKAGHQVTGFDITQTVIEEVGMAASAADCARGCEVVFTMLPNGVILQKVAAQIIPVMAAGSVLCDCSTVAVDDAKALAMQAGEAGLLAIDAPVSGGISGAAAGTLTFMVGGSEDGFAITRPLFDIMGSKAVHCGLHGAGQSVKICNNMIVGVTMIVTCESIALGDRLGIDRQKLFDVLSTSSGSSWSVNSYFPGKNIGPVSPADNDYKPGFASELMVKDLDLSQQAAESVNADTPMAAYALSLYQQFITDEGGRGRDFSAMLERFETSDRKSKK